MALVATELRDLLIENLSDKQTASEANTELGNTISNYVKDNAEVSLTWVAALPAAPFTPDTVVSASGKILTLSLPLIPSLLTEQTSAILALKTQFITNFALATYNITDSGFVTSSGLLGSAPTISTLNLSISGDNQSNALLQLASNIIDWIKLMIPATPCSGTRILTYTGVGAVVSIT